MVYRKTTRSIEAPRRKGAAVTTKDVAEAINISATTVASILSGRDVVRVSEETRNRVLHAAREMGYRRNGLASALRTGRTNAIGIVSPLVWSDVADGLRALYLTNLLAAVSVAAARAGFNAMTFVDTSFAEMSAHTVADGRVDGVILFGIPMDLPGAGEWVHALYTMGIPCAEIGSSHGPYQVHADNVGGARLATRHLIELGHRRIAYWRTPSALVSAENRMIGFLTEAREAGLTEEEAPVIQNDEELRALLALPASVRPTALFCCSDTVAVCAADLIHGAGLRIPVDISLIGFDNSLYAEMLRPRLTSVDNPLADMAAAAVALVQAQLDGPADSTNTNISIETRLVIHGSTAAPPPDSRS